MSSRVTFSIEKTLDRTAEVFAAVEKLAGTAALVGVPEEKGARDDGGDINNATLAYIHENGSDRARIPRREFMHPGVEKAKKEIDAHLKAASSAAWDGDENGIIRELNKAGQEAVNSIRGMFAPGNNAWEPVKPATQKAKGKKKTTTLIDTAQLRKSITHVVEEE